VPALGDFAVARKNAQEFARGQIAGVSRFWDAADGVVFKTEKDRTRADVADSSDATRRASAAGRPYRLTSTVTCLESLLEGPDSTDTADTDFSPSWTRDALATFMKRSLAMTEGWQSDGAAWVYCRVRTLGGALRLIDGGIGSFDDSERDVAYRLLRDAWDSKDDRGGSFGLQELTKAPDTAESGTNAVEDGYPPNAFLTYWGLLAADALSGDENPTPVTKKERVAAIDWMRATLGAQVALHYIGSTQADPQQLAWSICGLVRFGTPGVLGNSVSADRQLLVAGLRAFFEQQRGKTWTIGAPLFHFRNAGNAYAYIYETLAELLSLATSKSVEESTADALAAALRQHSQELLMALEYAEQISQPLGDGSRGWSSGHHPHRDSPESWATASVYRFAHALRRLLGMWSSAAAKGSLGARRPSGGLSELGDRGRTWNLGNGTAGLILATSYVHPTELAQQQLEARTRFHHDPDRRLLGKNQARSAMLFGPPGTGKTAMVEFVAGAIGWDFIEITPAQFLDHGVDHVSARADEIFRQIMELDRCVILFDEIDELIRRRSGESESIERFFTTTMLPRLAKMWDSRRVLFFVNTNNIAEVDNAIARSQRFDALIFVLPPDYAKKQEMLAAHGIALEVNEPAVTEALLKEDSGSRPQRRIGWFALIRYDQMDALAAQLRGATVVTKDDLIVAMQPISSELAQLDWTANLLAKPDASDPTLPNVAELHKFERQDPRLRQCARIDDSALIPDDVDVIATATARWAIIKDMTGDPEVWAKQRQLKISVEGVLEPNGES
jgi:hypothetical protein